MSCHGCTKKYGLFRKEHGCPNCGFSYCSSCLNFKAIVPKLGKTEHLVCRSCQTALGDMMAKSTQPDHPAAYIQRLESLDNPSKPPITLYKHDHRMEQLKTGLNDTDKELADRLERLREDRKREQLPTDDEIAKRLALLKGENSGNSLESKNYVFTPETRSEQQQVDELVQQYTELQVLSSKYPSPAEDIAQRLAKLRGQEPQARSQESSNVHAGNDLAIDSGNLAENSHSCGEMSIDEANALLVQLRLENRHTEGNQGFEKDVKECLKDIRSTLMKQNRKPNDNKSSDESECDEENDTEKVIQQVLDKAALEEKLALAEVCDCTEEEEELPWCVICNENAKRRCEGCDGDLYCESCFRQGHKDPDMKGHKSVPFKPIKNAGK